MTTLLSPPPASAAATTMVDIPVAAAGLRGTGVPATVRLEITASDTGLTGIHLVAFGSAAARAGAPAAASAHIDHAVRELTEYFAGSRREFTVPLDTHGTAFQQKVWGALRQIPFGQTRSYWWIAVRIGDPRAMRAVGAANGANPIPIIQPCHRVVRQDGSLGGFSAGLEWKRLLLCLEGLDPDNLSG